MGMTRIVVDDDHTVEVKDNAIGDDGIHFWLSLKRDGQILNAGACRLTFELLRLDEEDVVDHSPFIEAMARGFAAATLSAAYNDKRPPRGAA